MDSGQKTDVDLLTQKWILKSMRRLLANRGGPIEYFADLNSNIEENHCDSSKGAFVDRNVEGGGGATGRKEIVEFIIEVHESFVCLGVGQQEIILDVYCVF